MKTVPNFIFISLFFLCDNFYGVKKNNNNEKQQYNKKFVEKIEKFSKKNKNIINDDMKNYKKNIKEQLHSFVQNTNFEMIKNTYLAKIPLSDDKNPSYDKKLIGHLYFNLFIDEYYKKIKNANDIINLKKTLLFRIFWVNMCITLISKKEKNNTPLYGSVYQNKNATKNYLDSPLWHFNEKFEVLNNDAKKIIVQKKLNTNFHGDN